MADLRYTVDVDTRGAQTALNGLKSTIVNVGSALAAGFAARELIQIAARFEDLRTTLNFLYRDIEGGGEQAFNAIKQFATESVFSVEDLTASVIKLKAAGLNPTLERLRLFADVSSIATDSVGALQAITDLFARTTAGGLGLEDLNRLADRGIPVFDILNEKLGITRLEVSKLGQTTEGAQLILRALEEGLSETFGGASSERANNLSQAFSNLEDAIANTADVIGRAGLNQALGDAIRSITQMIESNKALIKSIAEGLIATLVFLGENLKYIAALLGGVFAVAVVSRIIAITTAVIEFTKALKAAAIAGTILQGVTGIGLVKLAAGMAGVAGTIAAINAMSEDAEASIRTVEDSLENLQNQAGNGTISFPDAPTIPTTIDENSPLRQELGRIQGLQNNINVAAISYFNEYRDGVADIRRVIEEETALVGLTEQQANVQRELSNFQTRYLQTIRPLQQQVTELRIKDTEESKVQADEIERQIGLITELYNQELGGLRESLELRERLRQEEEARLLLLNNRRDLEQTLRDLERDSREALEDLNLNPFERQLREINRQVDDVLVQSIRKIKSEWENGLITSDQYIAEIERLKQAAASTEDVLVENARRTRELQRSFAYGWKTAFENYFEDATNAAKQAERIFDTVTSNMEDMIVRFARTGKFEFKDFVASVLEDMLRLQVRQAAANILGMGTRGGGNILSGIGDFFAGFFANGGMIPAGQFGIVGERGPELVTGPANVTPLGATQVVYNINAVDAPSFRQLIARDPAFIHAVASKGGALPTRR